MSKHLLSEASRRFRIFKGALDDASMKEGEALLAELYKEFPESAQNRHLQKNILPVAALVRLFEKRGEERTEAIQHASQIYLHDYVEPAAGSMAKMLRLPLLYRLFLPLVGTAMRRIYKADYGFKINYHEMNSRKARFDVLQCPYFDSCCRLGYPELTDTFCTSDDMCYKGVHPKIHFEREGTIGRGQEVCDFYFHRD